MVRRVMAGAVLLALAAFAACENDGPNCCALRKFCSVCTTCSSDNSAMASKGDEVACKAMVEKFKSGGGQFCNPEDAEPRHRIDEFLLQCGSP
jgi:hypothetical protein